jgi:hypothetical protein
MNNINKKNNRKKIINQERLLLDIAKLVRKNLSSTEKSKSKLIEYLGKNNAFVDGVLHGFGNIRLRELSDIFSFFDKRICINLIDNDIPSLYCNTNVTQTGHLKISRPPALDNKVHEAHISLLNCDNRLLQKIEITFNNEEKTNDVLIKLNSSPLINEVNDEFTSLNFDRQPEVI